MYVTFLNIHDRVCHFYTYFVFDSELFINVFFYNDACACDSFTVIFFCLSSPSIALWAYSFSIEKSDLVSNFVEEGYKVNNSSHFQNNKEKNIGFYTK